MKISWIGGLKRGRELARWRRLVPSPVLETIELLGEGAVPTATVVLGAMLGGMSVRLRPHLWDATRAMVVKYGLLGECKAVSTACAAGTHSVAHGARLAVPTHTNASLISSAFQLVSETLTPHT